MIHYSKVLRGIAAYIDSGLVSSFAGSWKAWLLGGIAGLAVSKGEHMFQQIKNSPVAATLGLVEGENVDVDTIYAELRKQAQKGTATVVLPIVGPVTFGIADVESLFQHIRSA